MKGIDMELYTNKIMGTTKDFGYAEFDLSRTDWNIDYRKMDKVPCYNGCSNEACLQIGDNDNSYCIDCLRDLPKCPTCGVYFETEDNLNEIGDGGGFICEECLTHGDVEVVRCESERRGCRGTIIYKSEAELMDFGNGDLRYICEGCQERYSSYCFENDEEMEDFYEDLMEE